MKFDVTTSSTRRTRRRSSPPPVGSDPAPWVDPAFPGGRIVATHGQGILLAAATVVLLSLIFAPIGFWPLAFIGLVPWLVLVSGTPHAPRAYLYSFALALAFFLINMHWLYYATGYGYVTLAVYQALYFPLMACVVRSAVRRRQWPLGMVFPLVWTGGELVRAVAFSGFPWFFLAHSFYQMPLLIQISDLVGAYGVSFLAAAVNGAVADLIIRPPARGHSLTRRYACGGTVFAFLLLTGTIAYGLVQLHRETMSAGPKVAVLQGDYVNSVGGDADPDQTKRSEYYQKMEAVAGESPDIIVLPETPWIMYLNPEVRDFFAAYRRDFQKLRDFAVKWGTYVVTGSASQEPSPGDLVAKEKQYNSAMVFHPDGREPERYDKVHLVLFGEVVPFRGGRFHNVYRWLNGLMPFSGPKGDIEFSLFRGHEFRAFSVTPRSQPGRSFRFGIPICYEDVMPYVSREFTAAGSNVKKVDFLLNISNDGWFGRGSQQAQHLAICVFRAVENRVGIARAVNTGISGFIAPNGRLHDLVVGEKAKSGPGKGGFAVANVQVDTRFTVYSRYGDWFGWICALAWALLFLDYWILRAREAG